MQNDLKTAIEAARGAGEVLLSYFKSDYEIQDKGFMNPVTTADFAAKDYLEAHLRETRPEYGWLSEETTDSDARLERDRLWVVDPLDGTKEFIEGVPQFVVSIGLAEYGRPILGVLYNPVTQELFTGVKGEQAMLNGAPISASSVGQMAEADILNSRTESKRGLWKQYDQHFQTLTPVGSVAYKLGLVAAGKADMFATLRPKSEWDVCAGDIILECAGATMIRVTGEQVKYNQRDVIIRPGLVAGNTNLIDQFQDLYAKNSA